MSDTAAWQKNNEAHLSAALNGLRLQLTRLAEIYPPSPATAGEVVEPPRWGIWARRKSGAPPISAPTKLPQARVTDADVARAAAEMSAFESQAPPPALLTLSDRLGLNRFEAQVLLLCAAMELDTRIAGLCARAQDDVNKPHPTFALALATFNEPTWDALSAERPLRYFRLIEINPAGAQPLTASALRADERIVNYLKGLNDLDERLMPLLTPVQLDSISPPPSQQAAIESILRHLRQASGTERRLVIQLTGLDTASKRFVASQVAAALGVQLYHLPVEMLPTQATELETLARLWLRESLLTPVALYLDGRETETASSGEAGTPHSAPLNQWLARSGGLFFLDTRDVRPGLSETTAAFAIATPTPVEQAAIWSTALGSLGGGSPALLAGQFNLDAVAIQRIAQVALMDTPADEALLHSKVWAACRANTRPRLEALAQRLDAKATWDDIVLPADAVALLPQITAQVRRRLTVYDDWGFRARMNRGLGITALFAGESGTGKTMAAEVIANELQLDLYRIDLSAVVSKYIGETEKNLRRLFDAAEDGGAVLFFDEADALFGKRSEVKDSHDRYANIEVNYLLQRMEAYRGLAILATNMKSALDAAFMRRLRFVVNFAFPGPAERKIIWQKVFPPQTPTTGLDMERLARFNLTGGSIHAVALNAAFMAANRQPPEVTLPLVMEAVRAEFRKLERPINEAEFRLNGH